MVDLPVWKIWKPVGMMTFPIWWKNNPNVPNHQTCGYGHPTIVRLDFDLVEEPLFTRGLNIRKNSGRVNSHQLDWHTWKLPEGRGWNEMKWYMSCHVITLACRVMSWHVGVGGFWLGHLAISDNGNLQVRFHDDIDGSSLARAIYASTGILPSTAVSPLTLVGSSSCTRRHAVPSKDPMIFRSSVGFQEFLFGILAHSRQSTHPLWQGGNGRMTKIGC